MSSHEVGQREFVNHFFTQSRLSFIGTWRDRYEELIDSLSEDIRKESERESQAFLSDGKKCIIHVDMDAFFATCSLRNRPDLQGKPVVICSSGGSSNAEISCANYAARQFGIKAGMWLGSAREKCPQVVTLPYEFEEYINVAKTMYRCLFRCSPFVYGLSCDEAYVDITHLLVNGTDEEVYRIVGNLRSDILDKTKGCTASVGIGNSMLLARLATAKAKPNNLYRISIDTDPLDRDYFDNLSIRELPNIGWHLNKQLREELGVESCKQLQGVELNKLKQMFGEKRGEMIFKVCRGMDSREWIPQGLKERKSVGRQISWGVRMQDHASVLEFLDQLSNQVAERLATRKAGEAAQKVDLSVWKAIPNADPKKRKGTLGHGQCTKHSRSTSLQVPIVSHQDIFKHAERLYKKMDILPEDVRGFSLALSDFCAKDKAGDGFNRTWFLKKSSTSSTAKKKETHAQQQPEQVDSCYSYFETICEELDKAFREFTVKSLTKTWMQQPKTKKQRTSTTGCPPLCRGATTESCMDPSFCSSRHLIDAVMDKLWGILNQPNVFCDSASKIDFIQACQTWIEMKWANCRLQSYFSECCSQLLLDFI